MMSGLTLINSFYPEWNESLFYFINNQASNPFLDAVLPWLREPLIWLPLYVFIVAFLLINFRKKGLLIIIAIVLNFGVSDMLNARILKPMFNQERPCNNTSVQEQMVLRVKCGVGKSFPSSHAMNHFALAALLGLFLLRKQWYFLVLGMLWAGAVSYAQVYVGVHYPFDVMVGAAVGLFIAFANYLWMKRFIQV